MHHVVHVRPVSGAWLVDAGDETQVFTKASEAERWARNAAQVRADIGEFVELRVMGLRGDLAGSIPFHPRLAFA